MELNQSEIDLLHKKAVLLHKVGHSREAKSYEEVIRRGMTPEGFVLDVTPEEYEALGTKFAVAGLHLAEMGMPEWETPGQSIRFPFTIIEGSDKGKESKLVAGVGKAAAWKLKEILEAIGIAVTAGAGGKAAFDAVACVGKQFQVLWTQQKDIRTAEEGGTGSTYTKPVSAHKVGTTIQDLGI